MDSTLGGTNTKCERTFTDLHGNPFTLTTYLSIGT
jgi:hypothetical protein